MQSELLDLCYTGLLACNTAHYLRALVSINRRPFSMTNALSEISLGTGVIVLRARLSDGLTVLYAQLDAQQLAEYFEARRMVGQPGYSLNAWAARTVEAGGQVTGGQSVESFRLIYDLSLDIVKHLFAADPPAELKAVLVGTPFGRVICEWSPGQPATEGEETEGEETEDE